MDKKTFAKSIVEGVMSYSEKNNSSDVLGMVNKYLSVERRKKKASIITPKVLTKSEQESAGKLLTKLTDEKIDAINFVVDENLIDGLKVVYKDKMWDFSLQNQLDSIINP